jgi:hypothetical protein
MWRTARANKCGRLGKRGQGRSFKDASRFLPRRRGTHAFLPAAVEKLSEKQCAPSIRTRARYKARVDFMGAVSFSQSAAAPNVKQRGALFYHYNLMVELKFV